MTRDEFDDVLDAVTAAAIAYRGGLTDDATENAPHAPGTNPWTPIYSQLLSELETRLQVAGHRYERLADARGIDQADRFDWRAYLTAPDQAPHGSGHAHPGDEPNAIHSASRHPG